MKISVYHNLPPGGAKRVLYEQVKHLSNNHELYLYEIENESNKIFNLRDYAIKYNLFSLKKNKSSFLPTRLTKDYKELVSNYFINKKIANDINQSDTDVILVHTDKYLEAPYLLRFLEKPSFYYDQEMLALVYTKDMEISKDVGKARRFYEKFYRKIRKSTDYSNAIKASEIATNSNFMKNHIKTVYSRDSAVCYPGVNINLFKKTSKTANYLLFIGSKNTKYYRFAKQQLKKVNNKKDIKLKVILSHSNSLQVSNDENLSAAYSGALATYCLIPFEAFGLKAVESMACETPVLAVNEGGYRETVIDGVTGFLLPRDPKLFAEKIEWLIDNPEEARRMGKAGREHVKKNFTWEKHNKCIEKLLIETANAKK